VLRLLGDGASGGGTEGLLKDSIGTAEYLLETLGLELTGVTAGVDLIAGVAFAEEVDLGVALDNGEPSLSPPAVFVKESCQFIRNRQNVFTGSLLFHHL